MTIIPNFVRRTVEGVVGTAENANYVSGNMSLTAQFGYAILNNAVTNSVRVYCAKKLGQDLWILNECKEPLTKKVVIATTISAVSNSYNLISGYCKCALPYSNITIPISVAARGYVQMAIGGAVPGLWW
jgi:hypothetical protein